MFRASPHFTILMNVGLLSVAWILNFVSAGAATNRCPKENPYPFRNKTFCCSRPVDFRWQKNGYCYGRSQKCTFTEGCVNYHPLCDFIDKLIGIDFPSGDYNIIYEPALLPTTDFSHRFIFKESSTKENSEIHCLWQDNSGNWIMGLCENIESDIGQYFLDTDSECPNNDISWKEIENDNIVGGKIKELKDRIVNGRKVFKSRTGGIFAAPGGRRRKKVRKCEEWKKIPFTNQWRCFKFFPRRNKVKVNKNSAQKQTNCKVDENSGFTRCMKIEGEKIGNQKEPVEVDDITGDKQGNNDVEKQEDTSIEANGSEADYDIDSILSDIF